MSSQEFRDLIRIFTTDRDPVRQNIAIIQMLDPLDLDIEYKKLAREGDLQRIQDIFSSFADTTEDSLSGYEEKRLQQVSLLTQEYFSNKAYASFALMIYQLMVESFLERYDFSTEDAAAVTSHMLYQTLPEEIHLQTFLLESMANPKVFDWNRDDEVVVQSLQVLTVCFSDVYSFLTEEEDDDSVED